MVRLSICLTVVLIAGCISRKESFKAAPLNPAKSAARAMELYDANQDGALSGQELEKCPALRRSLALWDANGDRKIDQQEIQDRLTQYVERGPAYMGYTCKVLWNGQPLEGAEVKFVPEPFMERGATLAIGTTNENGMADMIVDPSQTTDELSMGFGIRPGLYRIEVRHPSVSIPARYNDQTQEGVDASPIEPVQGVELYLRAR